MSRPEALSAAAFWEFSLAFYRRPTIARACLSLQDRRNADVNLILLCCWLASRRETIDEGGLRAAVAAVADWRRRVIEPLRTVRHAVPDVAEISADERQAMKATLLAAELDAERIEQSRIAAVVAPHVAAANPVAAPREIARETLGTYLGLLVGEPSVQDRTDLDVLLEPL